MSTILMINITSATHRESNSPDQQQAEQGVEVQRIIPKPEYNGEIPEGYLTDDEFWKICRENVDTLCRKYGILE